MNTREQGFITKNIFYHGRVKILWPSEECEMQVIGVLVEDVVKQDAQATKAT